MASSGRKKSGRLFIILAIVLILILAVAGVVMLRSGLLGGTSDTAQTQPTQAPPQELMQIVVLTQPIGRGDAIRREQVELVNYPKTELMLENLFVTNVDEVVGMIAKYDMQQGVPLTASLVATPEELQGGSEASFRVPRGMVAIAIPINRLTSVAYALQPGDHVNIIASISLIDLDADTQTKLPNYTAQVIAPGSNCTETGCVTSLSAQITSGGEVSTQGRTELDISLNEPIYVIPSEEQRPRLVSQTLVRDAVVLWVGDFPESGNLSQAAQPAVETTTPEGEPAPPPARPDIITLIVSPQDAVTLNYLTLVDAKLNLALRGAGSDPMTEPPTEAVTLQFLMDQYNIPYPSKPPYGFSQRLDDVIYPADDNVVVVE
jgi:pilus assembly protein CpaB